MSVAKLRRKHGALAAEAVASASSRTRTPRSREDHQPRRSLPHRMRRLWRESLQFRALATAGVLMFLSFLAVGWSLSSQIATSLFENQKSQALQESMSGFRNVQSVLDSSEMRSDSEIRRNVSRTLTVLDAGASGKRSWILVPLEGQGKQGFIPEQSSDKFLNSSSIPTDFKNTVRDKNGVYWQTSTVTTVENNRERTYPVLIVGTHISIAQNPNYGLFTVYDMTDSSATIAHINFVLFGGFCALLTVVLSVVWFVTRFVVRPITQTAITAERLAAGDLDQRVSVKGEHQAARLGISFNRMADSLQEKIVQLERLSTLQQRFVSDVSHELRTPLSTVRLGTELLYDSRENMTPMQVRSVELLHGQVDRFQSMLADLLEISRFDAGSAMLTIDTEDFIQVLSNILQEALPHLERTNTKLNCTLITRASWSIWTVCVLSVCCAICCITQLSMVNPGRLTCMLTRMRRTWVSLCATMVSVCLRMKLFRSSTVSGVLILRVSALWVVPVWVCRLRLRTYACTGARLRRGVRRAAVPALR